MAQTMNNTGYRPPKPGEVDPRNFILEKSQPVQPFPSEYKTDISAMWVYMQAKIPDCVENGVTYLKVFHWLKSHNVLVDLCRRFLAAFTVKADGVPFENGTSLQVALQVQHNIGICETQYFPDDHQPGNSTPDLSTFTNIALIPLTAIDNAKNYTNVSYAFLSDKSANGLKNAIYQNGIILIGIKIDQNWWTDISRNVTWDKDKILPIRPPKSADPTVDPTISGHCIALFGYDENLFYFVNWWSGEWGDNGIGYFGVNDLPFVYEAATVLDLTDEQIAQQKSITVVQDQVQQVTEDVNKINPQDPNAPQEEGLVEKVVEAIEEELKDLI